MGMNLRTEKESPQTESPEMPEQKWRPVMNPKDLVESVSPGRHAGAGVVCAIFQGAGLHAARRADEPLVRRVCWSRFCCVAAAARTPGISPAGSCGRCR